ncbi:hypothetical protein [Micromonospora sp. NPDC049679]|uniref:hypothetical protein n=1 Tax=Micromonospora sp. NPDC049679 TaxID=3155920 RepID=UPI0033ED664C
MALPIPRPTAVLDLTRAAVGQAAATAAAFAALPGRAFTVLDEIESLVNRINRVVDRAETLLPRVDLVMDEAEEAARRVAVIATAATAAVEEATRVAAAVGVVVAEAQEVAGAATTVIASTRETAHRAQELLSAYEPTLRRAAPMAGRFVEQLSPEEVDAAIQLVDELPRLTRHLTDDVLPILATLDRVGPDIHDLLEVTRDLRLAAAGIPGLRMLRRRGEDRLAEEEAAEQER